MSSSANLADDVAQEVGVRATDVADRVRHWGFPAHPDKPDDRGPSFLLVALRPVPTLQRYDPEAVDYWVTERGRGERRTLTHETPIPRSEDFAWGLIRLVDRFGISNEYLTFGGHLDAALVDDVVVAAFASPVPLLRRETYSEDLDPEAGAVGAFFRRLMLAVDTKPGFEADLAEAGPLVRYAAFVRDGLDRRRRCGGTAPTDDEVDRLLRIEGLRLRTAGPEQWRAASLMLAAARAE